VRFHRGTVVPFLLAFVAAALCGGLAAGPAAAHKVAKGLYDPRLLSSNVQAAQRALHEDRMQLHARFIRFNVHWPEAQPHGPRTYNMRYLNHLQSVVQACKKAGLRVIITVVYVPRWASNHKYWRHPPFGYRKGVYEPFYPIARKHMKDFGRFTLTLARLLHGDVFGYECWNEPNLWPYIYPQRTPKDHHLAATLYMSMLRRFAPAVRKGDRRALVIAGATAPTGNDDRWRTTPQTFARALRAAGAGKLFDAYSHHPYTPGGEPHPAPEGMPSPDGTTVTLANLKTLLRIFPHKPFYLTEYGYNTKPAAVFGGFCVSARNQANYLRRAYAVAKRYRQVKMLMWFLVKDIHTPGHPASSGIYTGLRRLNGSKKPAWKAFARLH
jgi:Cellulase (glycosyl hydrolase family 5)